jgi:hypothetical protein
MIWQKIQHDDLTQSGKKGQSADCRQNRLKGSLERFQVVQPYALYVLKCC